MNKVPSDPGSLVGHKNRRFAAGSIALIGLIFGAIALTGCQKSKEQEAMDRIANRQPPSYIRLVNFGSDSVLLFLKNRQMPGETTSGTIGSFMIRPSGKQKVAVKVGKKELFNDDVSIEPSQCATVVVTSKDVKVYNQANRESSSPQASIHVIAASEGGPLTVQADGEPLFDKVSPESNTDMKDITVGHHKITVKTADGKSADAEMDFDATKAYTVFVNIDKQSPNVQIICDTPAKVPTAVGGSKAG